MRMRSNVNKNEMRDKKVNDKEHVKEEIKQRKRRKLKM